MTKDKFDGAATNFGMIAQISNQMIAYKPEAPDSDFSFFEKLPIVVLTALNEMSAVKDRETIQRALGFLDASVSDSFLSINPRYKPVEETKADQLHEDETETFESRWVTPDGNALADLEAGRRLGSYLKTSLCNVLRREDGCAGFSDDEVLRHALQKIERVLTAKVRSINLPDNHEFWEPEEQNLLWFSQLQLKVLEDATVRLSETFGYDVQGPGEELSH